MLASADCNTVRVRRSCIAKDVLLNALHILIVSFLSAARPLQHLGARQKDVELMVEHGATSMFLCFAHLLLVVMLSLQVVRAGEQNTCITQMVSYVLSPFMLHNHTGRQRSAGSLRPACEA